MFRPELFLFSLHAPDITALADKDYQHNLNLAPTKTISVLSNSSHTAFHGVARNMRNAILATRRFTVSLDLTF